MIWKKYDGLEDRNDMNDMNDTYNAQGPMSSPPGTRRTIMKTTQIKQTLEFQPRAKIRLSEIERLIRKHRIIVPPLSRQTLIKLCEDGTFETVGSRPTGVGWLVFEDSFQRWAMSLDEQKEDQSDGQVR